MISIIVPVYNVEKELPRCIESLIGQTYRDIEIILVNDGSTDESLKICNAYKDKDTRIRVIDKKNGGLSEARNYGIDASEGEFFLLVDSDDYIEKDSCEILIKGMSDPEVDFVVGAAREIRGKEEKYQRHTALENAKVYDSREFIIKSVKNMEWFAPAWLNLYRTDFFKRNSFRYAVGRYYEDMEIQPKIFLNAKKICYMDYCFYNYVIRDDSITSSKTSKKKTEDALFVYVESKKIYDMTEDDELRTYLYGYLVKSYLWSCRVHGITEWKVSGMNFDFARTYSLNGKEKFKALLFNAFPKLYVRMGKP